jgi:hypothetical protein
MICGIYMPSSTKNMNLGFHFYKLIKLCVWKASFHNHRFGIIGLILKLLKMEVGKFGCT